MVSDTMSFALSAILVVELVRLLEGACFKTLGLNLEVLTMRKPIRGMEKDIVLYCNDESIYHLHNAATYTFLQPPGP